MGIKYRIILYSEAMLYCIHYRQSLFSARADTNYYYWSSALALAKKHELELKEFQAMSPLRLKFKIQQNKRTGWYAIMFKEAGFFSFLRQWQSTTQQFKSLSDAKARIVELEAAHG